MANGAMDLAYAPVMVMFVVYDDHSCVGVRLLYNVLYGDVWVWLIHQ